MEGFLTPLKLGTLWGVHNEAELDLFLIIDSKRVGFEIKYTDSPKVTQSMKAALKLLKLDELIVIVPYEANYPLASHIRVRGLENYLKL